MTTVTDLYTRRAETWNKAKAFLDERRNSETGCLSAEDDATYAKMEAEIEALSNEIARSERAERLENNLAQATRAPITATPGTSPDENEGKAKRLAPQLLQTCILGCDAPKHLTGGSKKCTERGCGF